MAESRKYPRKKFDRSVKCITTSVMFDCKGVNLSAGGICIRSPIGFESGQGITLIIPLGDDEENMVMALGKVVWIEQMDEKFNELPVYAGIQFLATARKCQLELNKLCVPTD